MAGIDEEADGDGHIAGVDEVIEDGGDAVFPVCGDVLVAVLENHEGGGFVGGVLGGDVDEVFAEGAGENFGIAEEEGALDFALGDIWFGLGTRAEGVVVGGVGDWGAGGEEGEEEEFQRSTFNFRRSTFNFGLWTLDGELMGV